MFTLSIDTSNAAFDDGYGGAFELARILKKVAADLEAGSGAGTLRDYNGNPVGEWSV